MAKKNRFSAGPQMRSRSAAGRGPKKACFSSKKCVLAVDGRTWPDTLLTLPEAGLPGRKTRELVLACFWDCKLELNFVPVYRAVVPQTRNEGGRDRKTRLSFFCDRKQAQNLPEEISGLVL